MATVNATGRKPQGGAFANGMQYVTWGSGPKTLLVLPGGPGSALQKGIWLLNARRLMAPYVKAGFTPWIVGRRRHMPPGHTIADMADDYAQMINQEFGGRVDLVVGESYGGMIGQYLAAFHPGSFGHVALVVTAAEASDWCKDTTSRMAAGFAAGGRSGAGAAVAGALLAGKGMRWVCRLIGPLLGWLLLARDDPPEDVLTEAQAQEAFDSRAVLPRIRVPVLLLCSDRDVFFLKDVAEETAELIPDCTLIWYRGQSHPKVAFANRRVPHDVLTFVDRAAKATSAGHPGVQVRVKTIEGA